VDTSPNSFFEGRFVMEEHAIKILNAHRVMAISTIRPDGGPQTTIVGYANDGLLLYFMISRDSQKFANIQRDNRISVAIGQEPKDLFELEAVYASATASEVTAPEQRKLAWRLLTERHPNLADFELPAEGDAALMEAKCEHLSVLDFREGLGAKNALASAPLETSLTAAAIDRAAGCDTPI
jgi:nitroimidazol reductase NimA-like FMN-containing flavoprotein (pyridoxamine 5'-phosphate oxidase superfamily)